MQAIREERRKREAQGFLGDLAEEGEVKAVEEEKKEFEAPDLPGH